MCTSGSNLHEFDLSRRVSWKALDWATDADVGSPVLKLILILLSNKADEQFSCFPSVRTLVAESGAGRSTVLRALNTLETEGFITRRAQFHESGAQRSSRYYLNHPDAPHRTPRPGTTLPRPDSARAGSRSETGGVSTRHPPREPERDPLNPSHEPPSEPNGARADRVFQALPPPWTVGRRDRAKLAGSICDALDAGWTIDVLIDYLSRSPEGVRFPARVLATRLADLPVSPHLSGVGATVSRAPWCGECEDERSRTMTVAGPNGADLAIFCPRCSPQAHRPRQERVES